MLNLRNSHSSSALYAITTSSTGGNSTGSSHKIEKPMSINSSSSIQNNATSLANSSILNIIPSQIILKQEEHTSESPTSRFPPTSRPLSNTLATAATSSVSPTLYDSPMEMSLGGTSGGASSAAQQRRRVTDKSVMPISMDIAKNREFYRTHDVRPPYTYAVSF